jgi:signal transduction histidine kinase
MSFVSVLEVKFFADIMRASDSRLPSSWQEQKFVTRAKTLFYARLAFLSVGLTMLAVPRWAQFFGAEGMIAFAWFFVMITYSVGNYLVIEHRWLGKAATFSTLCVDVIVLVYMISYSGGLRSPVLPTQVVFTMFFAFLFPNPLAIVPPLLTLPVVAKIDTELPGRILELEDIFTLLWYSAVNFIVVYVIVRMNEQEDRQHNEVVALQKDIKKMAIEQERNRLSREIHDGLGASLSSLIIQSEYLHGLTSDEEIKTEISELKEIAEESIDELRRSISMLQADFDLVPTLEDYCYTFAQRVGMEMDFSVNGKIPGLAGKQELAIFRVLQEALTNAGKHSQGNNIKVSLVSVSGVVRMVVEDDGKGFDYSGDLRGRFGLVNMQERARQFGGSVSIESQKDRGCKITFEMPIKIPR